MLWVMVDAVDETADHHLLTADLEQVSLSLRTPLGVSDAPTLARAGRLPAREVSVAQLDLLYLDRDRGERPRSEPLEHPGV